MALTAPEEAEIICSAIYHHDDKSVMDAFLKDGAVNGHGFSRPAKEVRRYARLRAETGALSNHQK